MVVREIKGVVGRYGVPGVNERGKKLLDICVEKELTVSNTLFEKKNINIQRYVVAPGR